MIDHDDISCRGVDRMMTLVAGVFCIVLISGVLLMLGWLA